MHVIVQSQPLEMELLCELRGIMTRLMLNLVLSFRFLTDH